MKPAEPQHSDSTLRVEAEPSQPGAIRRGKLHCKGPGEWAAPAPGDHFASHQSGPCVDSCGAHWPEHWYALETRQGTRCVRCLRLRRMETLG